MRAARGACAGLASSLLAGIGGMMERTPVDRSSRAFGGAVEHWSVEVLQLLVAVPAAAARRLPAIGVVIALAALTCTTVAIWDSGWSWQHKLQFIGAVATLNADWPDSSAEAPSAWLAWAHALAAIAAGILALEIFRFLAGRAYDGVRVQVRRVAAGLVLQRRVLVVGHGPEADSFASQLALVRKRRSGAAVCPYQITRLITDGAIDTSAAPRDAVMVMHAPSFDVGALRSVGAGRFDDIVLLAPSDARAIEMLSTCLAPSDADGNRRAVPPRIRVRLESPEVAESVRRSDWYASDGDSGRRAPEVRVWLPDDLAARKVLRDCRLDWRHPFGIPGGATELVCIGFGPSQQAFALAVLRQAHHVDEQPLRLTIVDPDAERVVNRLRGSYPSIDQVAELRLLESDGREQSVRAYLAERAVDPRSNLCIAISVGDIDRNVEIALGLPDELRSAGPDLPSPPIFVRQSGISDVSWIFRRLSRPGARGGLSLRPWGGLRDGYDPQLVLEGSLDLRARRVHDAYLQKYPPKEGTRPDPFGAGHPWERLSGFLRDDNRNSADFLGVRLRAVGLRVADPEEISALHPGARLDPSSISAAERETMARLEHRRWVVMRLLSGWQRGERRDNARRIHDNICPWSELTAADRAKDDLVANLQVALLPGEAIVREAGSRQSPDFDGGTP